MRRLKANTGRSSSQRHTNQEAWAVAQASFRVCAVTRCARGYGDDIRRDSFSSAKHRTEESRYARRVTMEEIEKNDFNLNISRYVSTAKPEEKINLSLVNTQLLELENKATKAVETHNQFLKELGLALLPVGADDKGSHS